ncbi:MAG: outer membrane lipoprotein-sorting protein [Deltaproteobacteria bacterium]|jgi:outer membrane lipoprotein-sorting protein|nr:outer membrane lipoprotein-sorting protein [Deltaproteobacteria bacterium]
MPRTLAITVAAAALLAAPAAISQSATDILEQADAAGHTDSARMEITQVVTTPGGDSRTFQMVSYSRNGNEKGLTEYVGGGRAGGMKILTLNDGDDIWAYFDRTNRVRKIASSSRNRKVQGSDFTYDDMASGKMASKWQGQLTGSEKVDGVDCHELTIKPTASGPQSYSKAIAWISKADHTTRRVDYYDLYGDLLKRLEIGDYRKVSGVWVPFRYKMTNLTDGGSTEMTVTKAEVNIELRSGMFTEAGLKR